ncbi:MAG TPA: hypothetical protein VF053_16310 [Streptosporangiales bacterium]
MRSRAEVAVRQIADGLRAMESLEARMRRAQRRGVDSRRFLASSAEEMFGSKARSESGADVAGALAGMFGSAGRARDGGPAARLGAAVADVRRADLEYAHAAVELARAAERETERTVAGIRSEATRLTQAARPYR